MGLRPTSFHLKWQRTIDEHARTIIRAAPETGKSSQFLLLRPIHELGQNQNLRIALISETATLARKWLGRIKENILWNARIHEVYPELRPSMRANRPVAWYSNAILVERDLEFSLTDPHYSIEAIGVGGTIMGSRFDLVFLDDVITNRNALTEAGRDKIYDWIKQVLIGRLTKRGRVAAINNTWHEEDAFHRLPEEQPDVWHVETLVAGTPEAEWLEVYPPERLAALKAELGDIEYGRQFLQIPLGSTTNLLPYESIRDCQRRCADPLGWWGGEYERDQAFHWVTAGLDLGASERPGSNLSAIAVVGVDQAESLKHLLHLRAGQWMGQALLQECILVQRSMRPHEWLVETNAAQAHVAAMLGDPVMVAATAQAIGIPEAEALELAQEIRVFGQYTTLAHKRGEAYWAIRGMGSEFDARTWRLPQDQPEVEYLIREARRYSLKEHTGDRLIAFWLANLRLEGIGSGDLIDAISA